MTDQLPVSPDRVPLVQRLFVECQPALRAFIQALLPDFSQAQDVLQETFLTATQKADDFVPDSDFIAWVCTIARYKVLEAHHERKFLGLTVAAIEAVCAAKTAAPEDPRTRSARAMHRAACPQSTAGHLLALPGQPLCMRSGENHRLDPRGGLCGPEPCPPLPAELRREKASGLQREN